MAEQSDPRAKGFGKPVEPAKPAAPKRRRAAPRLSDEEFQARRRYEAAEKKGEPTFEIFVRESGQDEWKAAGAIAVAANLVEQAIFDSEEKLRQSALRQYAALRKATNPLEYGFRRKEFPDDAIQLAQRPKPNLINKFRNFLSSKFSNAVKDSKAKGNKGNKK
ncbi:MAG: hypothetical protein KME03_20845 [Aphanocapsa lilacina HA4352-LM1]|jgi:hypothetical protein|nr:hypothetical protein [Aphanocapsa lilacina HA4352-LM1]